MKTPWLTATNVALACCMVPWQQGTAAPVPPGIPQTAAKKSPQTPAKAAATTQPKKPKVLAKSKKPPKKPAIPGKPPADIPEVKEAATVWRGCLESHDLPGLATGLGMEESRLQPLLAEQGVVAEPGKECVPYVAATGGEGGTASAVFQIPEPKPGEAAIVDLRKTADGITITPAACDCPDPARRVLEFSVPDILDRRAEALATAPDNVRWQLDTLMPQMIRKLVTEAGGNSYSDGYKIRVALERSAEYRPEHLQSVEVLETATGKRVDGAWWLDRAAGPGVLIGMEGAAYERLLWQSPVKYVQKSRGIGPAVTTFFHKIPVPKGSNEKPKTKAVTVREYHLGSDLMAAKGTEVHAVGDATVAYAGYMGGFGKLIILDHGLGYQTYYAHLSVIKPATRVGASVSRGDVIGLVGSTGRSTAPHLHFETRKDAKYIDPFDDSRQLEFWLLSPDDQERLAMELLAAPSPTTQNVGAAE